MTVKRYFAATARDALRRVKEDLGVDAIVISNKSVRGGVEITAMSAASLDEISSRAEESENRLVASGGARQPMGHAAPLTTRSDDYTVSISTQARRVEQHVPPSYADREAPAVQRRPVVSPWQPPRYEPETGRVVPPAAPPTAAREAAPSMPPPAAPLHEAALDASGKRDMDDRVAHEGANLAAVYELTREMQDIRGLLEQQLAGFAWGELSRASPARAQLMTELLEMGFSGVLARRMTQDLAHDVTMEEARRQVAAVLDRRLRLLDADSDFVNQGGVYALVGPTGVGKTTTAAKLAARCVVRYGADRVALLTTDGYRIGAHEQLRIYGRILGVPVHAVGNGEELRQTLAVLKDKHMVLIDTVGMSQRDSMVIEQGNMLANGGGVKRLLLLNATARGDTLDDVIQAYGGEKIAACIVSKIDETITLAPAVDAVVRHGMQIAYLANGQRVPEDLHLPNRKYLLHRVFKQRPGTVAHRLKGEEAGMILAAQGKQPERTLNLG